MPLDMRKEKRDLYVAFEVLFATSLTEEQKTNYKNNFLLEYKTCYPSITCSM